MAQSNENPWDLRYSGEGFFYGTEPNDFLREMAPRLPKGGRVLFLAEGEGRNAVWFAAHDPAAEVVAVDGSRVGLEKAQRLARDQGVRLETHLADLAHWDLGSEAWDGIVSIWAHTSPEVRVALHARCVAALRPGGFFVLEAYHPRQLQFKTGGPPDARMMMTAEGLRQELSGLELLLVEEKEREIQEGLGHQGRSAVTRFLGVRGGVTSVRPRDTL